MEEDYILEAKGLVKEFRGFVAVNGVDLKVRRGSIHALIGPNGAGKTTVFNLLTKFLPVTRGQILYQGRDITHYSPARVAQIGIVRSFQISSVFPHLTALENVRLGLQAKAGGSFAFWRSGALLHRFDEAALALLEQVGLREYAKVMAVELPYGRKRALEIATTLAADPELMLLDEPTQGMGTEDVEAITALLKRMAQGRTVLMVEHNLGVVAHLADRITVLQRGTVLAEGTYAEVSSNPEVIAAYLGVAHA
ncbi:ABC transporter ATP-binding protein [Tepidiphilus olei]|uniref:ABC transporter ATP-binding protein n=1 Tax=Tepidiphilus olei TaxID=2502184 RepID=UPI00115D3C61|nr:ABC transporter ATP-binding protein [Tepidiphilus olei]